MQPAVGRNPAGKDTLLGSIKQHPLLYVMVLPGVVFFILFRIVPYMGSVIAWQKYSVFAGIFNSQWVGWENFIRLFSNAGFKRAFWNTLSIAFLTLLYGFPLPILYALLVNELTNKFFKKSFLTAIYIPHFLSWVIVGEMVYAVLHPSSGFVNLVLQSVGIDPIFFMTKGYLFKHIAALSHVWKEAGFASIVYMAAISAIDPNVYEAADIDGANRLQKMVRITLPLMVPTITIMMLLQIGMFLNVGFDHIWNLLNSVVWSDGDILSTYIYRVGLREGEYSLTTAAGLFKAVVGFVLLISFNTASQKFFGRGFFNK